MTNEEAEALYITATALTRLRIASSVLRGTTAPGGRESPERKHIDAAIRNIEIAIARLEKQIR